MRLSSVLHSCRSRACSRLSSRRLLSRSPCLRLASCFGRRLQILHHCAFLRPSLGSSSSLRTPPRNRKSEAQAWRERAIAFAECTLVVKFSFARSSATNPTASRGMNRRSQTRLAFSKLAGCSGFSQQSSARSSAPCARARNSSPKTLPCASSSRCSDEKKLVRDLFRWTARLDLALARLVEMVGCSRDREARDGDRVAPARIRAVLNVEIASA